MKRALFLTVVAAVPCSIASNAFAADVDSKTLNCSVEIVETRGGGDTTPKTEDGKRFAAFQIDQSIDPDLGWMHQNLCVTKADFVKATFPGNICVVAIGSRIPAAVDGGPGLYVDVIHSVRKNRKQRLDGSNLSLSTAYPMPLPQLELSLGSTAHAQKSGIAAIHISCTPSEL